eukprot:TRINITY_DN1156_c0_g1_i2.p1 TRINITY_DN1156_c0_g1~~TRINITY_DN1156_c0_g1_i2.p1  ORF type:complete len:486 (+),score=59.71 TRINITY_DN1156_c0_g1_i2:283-1740(+)
MNKSEVYRCRQEELWRRQIGDVRPEAFSRKIGGCQDLVQRFQQFANLEFHDGCVNTVHFSPSGELLVSGSDDRYIVFWDWAAKTKRLHYDSGHESNVFQARIMPFSDDRQVVSCGADGQVRYAEISESGKAVTKQLAKHRERVHKVAIEPGSPRTFFSCGEDGVVRHFDLRESKSSKLFTCHAIPSSEKPRRSQIVRLNAIVINPRNPNYFSVGGSDEYARVYDIRRVDADASSLQDKPVDVFTPSHLIGVGQVHITCVAYSLQEELLVSYNDELIYSFDKDMGLGPDPKASGESKEDEKSEESQNPAPQVYKGHRNAQTVKGVNFFGPNTEYVVSGSDCGHIFIWKKRGGQLIQMIRGDNQVVNCLEPHPYATILATSGFEKHVKVWAPIAEKIQSLPENAARVMEMNRRRREDRSHLTLTPDVIMHVLRLQRRQAQSDMERGYPRMEYEGDDDDDEYLSHFSDDDDSSDEGSSHVRLRECIIS